MDAEPLRVLLSELWPHLLATVGLATTVGISIHIVLSKKDSRAALSWLGLVWLAPVVGALLYLGFGINRIERRAQRLRIPDAMLLVQQRRQEEPGEGLREPAPLGKLARLVGIVSKRALTPGNRVGLLVDAEAYPAMLAAIRGAQSSIALQTFLFKRDALGLEFADALGDAVARGVQVRVLIDGVGAHYNFVPVYVTLAKRGVPTALFLFSWNPWRMPFLNLRNHRKLLVIDGRTAFTGGMNIQLAHALDRSPPNPTRDLMVEVCGPVVPQLFDVFAEDWLFTTREALVGPSWVPPAPVHHGPVMARAVSDGPDGDIDRLWRVLLGALATAHDRVAVITPYFVPEESILTALATTAMRGVRVDIVLPGPNNFPHMTCATRVDLPPLLAHGVRVWRTPLPFDHTKLMVIDGQWALIGSTNWDARSLRLNFELNLECYDPQLALACLELVDRRIEASRPWTLEEVEARSLPGRLLDGVVHLAKPYL